MEAEVIQRCNYWLSKKKRFCANSPINNSVFCGNHNPKSDEPRIPCPIDPSHTVLQGNIDAHVKRCPFLKQDQSLRMQPFFKEGINAGTDDDDENDDGQSVALNPESVVLRNEQLSESGYVTTATMKRNYVFKMAVPEFIGLIKKVESIHKSLCSNLKDSYKILEACREWMNKEINGKLPFQEKHVLQQASILGNLEEFGVLETPEKRLASDNSSIGNNEATPAVVEFGAGRGYLTQMLADCYGIKKVFLVERRSYKLKADRSLRQKESLVLERLRIDIEDLDLNSVEALSAAPYLAIGKHLCGPATDLTLRCCLHKQCTQLKTVRTSNTSHLRGLAIAACCHHLCQWKHYISNILNLSLVNLSQILIIDTSFLDLNIADNNDEALHWLFADKSYLSSLGIKKEDFHAVTWFTSWAVDADHGSDLSNMVERGSSLDSISDKSNHHMDAGSVEEIVRSIPAVERAALGFMCKDIIDIGRLMWLEDLGLEAELVKYVPSNISPENHLLIAKSRNCS